MKQSATRVAITSLVTLDEAFQASRECTVIIFNHDPHCPISAGATAEMSAVSGDVRTIDVSREREVTRELTRRTGVRHESPQVIVLRNGEAVWDESHWGITGEAVAAAVDAAG